LKDRRGDTCKIFHEFRLMLGNTVYYMLKLHGNTIKYDKNRGEIVA
jgi:hypothetical protein